MGPSRAASDSGRGVLLFGKFFLTSESEHLPLYQNYPNPFHFHSKLLSFPKYPPPYLIRLHRSTSSRLHPLPSFLSFSDHVKCDDCRLYRSILFRRERRRRLPSIPPPSIPPPSAAVSSTPISSAGHFFHRQNHLVRIPRMNAITADQNHAVNQSDDSGNHPPPPPPPPPQPLSKNAQKKLLKQQRFEAKKAEKKAAIKEEKKRQGERKRKEWEEKLSSLSEEEKMKMIEERKGMRKERMDKRTEEREGKALRLSEAKKNGQNIVVDLEFSDLMAPNEIHSLINQIMYCYAVNGRSTVPCHLWLTGYEGEIESQLQKIPGFDKWIIGKDNGPYINTFESQKEHLVYLTADSETMLSELDPKKIYIVGGLVDRNRWKGITMKKAVEQGIQTAKLPIGNYLKMSSSQVLTVNQVIEILVKYLETKDWKASFFHVIPQRKRGETEAQGSQEEEAQVDEKFDQEIKRQCVENIGIV